jgi:MbtH protein
MDPFLNDPCFRAIPEAGIVVFDEWSEAMSADEREDMTVYKVVVNHEEQYSIWPVERDNPLGWRDVGKSGSKAECLAQIREVWTDMRPLSLRKKMHEVARHEQGPSQA